MRPIPNPVRERIIMLYEQGKRTEQIASALGYCQPALRRVRQHFNQRGTAEHHSVYPCFSMRTGWVAEYSAQKWSPKSLMTPV